MTDKLLSNQKLNFNEKLVTAKGTKSTSNEILKDKNLKLS
jgi:hypothetical protein